MGRFEEAVIYATNMHNGKTRKVSGVPAILHSMEVAQIISLLTDNVDVMIAGLLHDVVEDTDGTLEEIREKFGDRVAKLVGSETENKYEGTDKSQTWKRRKEESIKELAAFNDRDVEILWLADKLSNIRSLARDYSERGDKLWESFNQKDPQMHKWYYKTIAEILEMHFNRTGAYKEYVLHINSIWPGTFSSDKLKYKKYKEVSLDGLKLIGRGAKSDVYKYDEELVIKLYNEDNEYKDIERENYIARQAFIAGIPTAINFGIVKVGNRYGSMFELLDSTSVTTLIKANPLMVEHYAEVMANLAKKIHSIQAGDMLIVPNYMENVYSWIDDGVAYIDEELTSRIKSLVDELPECNTLIHGDFHTGNVMTSKNEYMMIDMGRLSVCHPIVELSGVYMFYVGFRELDEPIAGDIMGLTRELSAKFFNCFMKSYLGKEDIGDVVNKAALLCYVRLVRRCYKKGFDLSPTYKKARDYYVERIRELINKVDKLAF